ncbi:MAG: YneF family protein, partial [Oscillospiraceae bacterium]
FLGLAVGLVIGFFVARYVFKKNLQKNPPINEKMIRAMFMEMGRKPNETQIKRIMKSINDQYK